MSIFVVGVIILSALFSIWQANKAVGENKKAPLEKESQIFFFITGIFIPVLLYALASLTKVTGGVIGVIVCSDTILEILALQVLNTQGKHRAVSWTWLAIAYAVPLWTSIAKLMDKTHTISPKPLIIPGIAILAVIITGVIRTKRYDAGKAQGTTTSAAITVAITAAVIAAVVLF